uniref:Retrotransposon gag domain-containing protein n=1 Tax=Cajanus cajan TaxID=3821 RepID=A0A151UHG2_CAJCA
MRGTVLASDLAYDLEIEKTARRDRGAVRKQRLLAKQAQYREATSSSLSPSLSEILEEAEMAEERPRITLGDHAVATGTTHFSRISTPAFTATNFEMKPALLNLIQNNKFAGVDHEDPYLHLHTFIELCGTVKIHQVPEEVIQMNLFPFSLLGKAKIFFPLAKINQAKSEIVTFSQKQDELLSEAWERYKSLLRRCPSHGFDDLTQVNIFLGGLQPRVKILLDASAGGSMRFKTPEEAIELIDAMAANDYDLPAERESRQKRGILELGSQDALLAQNKLLSQQIEALTKQVARIPQQLQSTQHQVLSCDLCGLNHPHGQCIDTFPSHGEEVNYMGNQARQGGNYGGNYGKNWQSHPSTGWNQNDIAQSSRPSMQRPNLYDRQSKLEETVN